MTRSAHLFAFLALAVPATALDPAAFAAAVEHYAQRRPAEARAAFEALASAAPDNADVQFYLGRLALQRADAAAALAHLERAVALRPADSRMHHRLGDAYGLAAQRAGLFGKLALAEKCRAAYVRAVELDPRNLDARASLVRFYRQAPAVAGGGSDKALAEARALKELDATRGRLALADLHAASGRPDLARAEFTEILAAAPDDYFAHFHLGRLAAESGLEAESGLAHLRRCLTLPPPAGQPGPAVVQRLIGDLLVRRGDPGGARAAYAAALGLDPDAAGAREALRRLAEPPPSS